MTLCSPWIDGTDVAACCSVEESSDPSIFDAAAELASELLFYYSLRRFPGICEATARPCAPTCGCPWQILSRGHIVWNPSLIDPRYGSGFGFWSCGGDPCGCRPLSRVLLAGRVQEITEVLIDGVVVDPATYRVDQRRWLTRVRVDASDESFEHWPACQNMDLTDDQPGTWSVTYTYGQEAPVAAQEAAAELACEIYKQCNQQACALPKNTVRVTRQGIAAERPSFIGWGFEKGGRTIPRGWRTQMPKVDMFLNAYNPTGLVRIPIVWTPTSYLQYAPTLGSPLPSS